MVVTTMVVTMTTMMTTTTMVTTTTTMVAGEGENLQSLVGLRGDAVVRLVICVEETVS